MHVLSVYSFCFSPNLIQKSIIGKIVKIEEITKAEEEKTEKLEIRVKDKEKATQILKDKFSIESKIENDKIEITVLTEQVPIIVKELALQDVEIKAIIPKENTLEDIFFDATKGGQNE